MLEATEPTGPGTSVQLVVCASHHGPVLLALFRRWRSINTCLKSCPTTGGLLSGVGVCLSSLTFSRFRCAHNNIGVVMKERGDLVRAQEAYQLSIQSGPKQVRA